MSKPVVLFISDVPDFKGGAERSLFDLMANPYIEAELCVPAEGEISKAATEKSIPFHTLDYGSVLTVRRPFKIRDIFRTFFAALRAASALKKLSKTRGASYVHTNGLKAHGVACLARLCSGRPVIAHFRAVPFTKLEKLFWRAVQIIATHLVLVSRPCWPGKKLPVNTHVIFNGIHLPDRAILPPLPPKTPFILGFVGRIQFAWSKTVDLKSSVCLKDVLKDLIKFMAAFTPILCPPLYLILCRVQSWKHVRLAFQSLVIQPEGFLICLQTKSQASL